MPRALRVEDLMSTALVCVRDADTLDRAKREMRSAGIHHLPVVDAHRNLVGVLSTTDLAKYSTGRWSHRRVGTCMTRAPVAVRPETSMTQARGLMLENGFRSLPVVGSDGHLIGILTETDLLRASEVFQP